MRIPDQLLFLAIDRNDRVALLFKRLALPFDVMRIEHLDQDERPLRCSFYWHVRRSPDREAILPRLIS